MSKPDPGTPSKRENDRGLSSFRQYGERKLSELSVDHRGFPSDRFDVVFPFAKLSVQNQSTNSWTTIRDIEGFA
ncbi:MAG: hypothetical protein ACMG6H_00905 [Acidobacteriota bacterium]